MKIKVSQAQSNWFAFKEAPPYKSGCADLHNPDMSRVKWVRQQQRTVMLWEFFFYIYLCSKWYQKHSISWLQKNNLKQLLFEEGTFSEPLVFTFFLVFPRTFTFWKELACLFYKFLLPFLTSWIAKVFSEGLLYKIGPCFDTDFAERYSIIIPNMQQLFRICPFCNTLYNIS